MSDELATPPDNDAAAAGEEEIKWPISFMLILGVTAIYVGWRVIQLIGNLFG